jgi:UDP:flavonoid glycosyltransferase YjiC (YdhE family)
MRIVFASLGSLGDLHPLLALARGAAARGHHPIIATSRVFEDYVLRLGFDFRAIRPDFEFDPALVERLFHPTRGPERMMREQVFPNVRATYTDLLAATADADLLLVGELLYVAPLVAAERRIPWANAILAPTSFLSADDPCILAPFPWLHPLRHLGHWPHRLVFFLGRHVTRRWGAPLTALRRELGHPPAPSAIFDAKHSPDLTLALFPKFLAAPQPDWPAQTRQTGFPYFDQPIAEDIADRLDRFRAAGPAPIVFTLGSSVVHIARDFYPTAARVAQRLGRRAILLTGNNPAPPDLPPTTLALDYAPLNRVLPGAAAVVHQGGIGTCAEALRHGVPSLVIPHGFDQPDNADRLRRLGVAQVLARHRVSERNLADGLTSLLAAPPRDLAAQIQPDRDLADSLDALERIAPLPAG